MALTGLQTDSRWRLAGAVPETVADTAEAASDATAAVDAAVASSAVAG